MAKLGSIGWIDLTVDDAPRIRDFYHEVVGWNASGVPMGEGDQAYEDYMMAPPNEDAVAGVCHRRGTNANIPQGWMLYVIVDQLDHRIEKVTELGGKVLKPICSMGGHGRYAVISDPSGATIALFEASA